jgi:hypothetical protein
VTVQRISRVPSMAVVVCTSSMQRAPLLRACVDSLLCGQRKPDELYVVVDTNPRLAEELAGSLPPSARLLQCDGAGLSAARNAGVAASNSDVVSTTTQRPTLAGSLRSPRRSPPIRAYWGPEDPYWRGGVLSADGCLTSCCG